MRDRLSAGVFFGLLAAVIVACCNPQPSWASIIVRFDPPSTTVNLGDGFDVQLRADIGDAVIGWGLDVGFDPGVLSVTAPPAIGPTWSAAYAPDGDGLVGLAFPDNVTGNDILLATLHLKATTVGETDLVPSITTGDLAEGFALYPTGFAQLTFQPAHVKVIVPEPATLILLASASLAFLGGRRGERRP